MLRKYLWSYTTSIELYKCDMKNIHLLILSFFQLTLFAQNVELSAGNTQIAKNETFQLTLKITGERLKSYSDFPEIPGMQKYWHIFWFDHERD